MSVSYTPLQNGKHKPILLAPKERITICDTKVVTFGFLL